MPLPNTLLVKQICDRNTNSDNMTSQLYAKHLNTWAGSLYVNRGGPSAHNLAATFTPTQPMHFEGIKPDLMRAKGDTPTALLKQLVKGLGQIGPMCLRQKAAIYLSVYEDICLGHVLDKQIHDKELRKLMAVKDPSKEHAHANDKKVATNVVAHSSLIGQDPWGDKPVPAPSLPANDTNSVATTGYTKEELLLMQIQDQNYLYLVAHVEKILHHSITTAVKERELEYKRNDQGIRDKTPRKRMPWREYKEVIVDLLPTDKGLHTVHYAP